MGADNVRISMHADSMCHKYGKQEDKEEEEKKTNERIETLNRHTIFICTLLFISFVAHLPKTGERNALQEKEKKK